MDDPVILYKTPNFSHLSQNDTASARAHWQHTSDAVMLVLASLHLTTESQLTVLSSSAPAVLGKLWIIMLGPSSGLGIVAKANGTLRGKPVGPISAHLHVRLRHRAVAP